MKRKILLLAIMIATGVALFNNVNAQVGPPPPPPANAQNNRDVVIRAESIPISQETRREMEERVARERQTIELQVEQMRQTAETYRQSVEVQREQMRQLAEEQNRLRASTPSVRFQFNNVSIGASRLDLSRTVNDSSFTEEYSFNIEKTAKSVILSVSGNCTAGEIRIKILTPNGQVYSETLIDASGNMNWRRTITISETENQDKTGGWKCQVTTRNATGNYNISVQVN
jgi:hypothetical protein